ncbi:MAG: alpha/beta fold hydrolase [Nibricoccus sp.]
MLLPQLQRLLSVAAFFFTSSLHAASPIDLKRIDPVPDGVPIPTQDFFRPLLLAQPQLNDAGNRVLALITIDEDKTQLLVTDLDTQKIDILPTIGDKDIVFATWLDDSHLIFNVSDKKIYGLGWMTAAVEHLDYAYPILQYCGAHLVSVPHEDRMHPLFWLRNEIDRNRSDDSGCVVASTLPVSKDGLINLYGASASREALDAVIENNGLHIKHRYGKPQEGLSVGYMCDNMGKLAYAFTDKDGFTKMHWLDNREWRTSPINFDDDTVIVGSGDNPRQIVVVSGPRNRSEPRSLRLVDATTGKEIEELLKDKNYDFDGWLQRDPVSHNIIGAVYSCETPVAVWFNEEYRLLQTVLNSFFPGLIVRIQQSDPKRERFLVSTFSDRQPVIYYTVNLKTKEVGLFKKSRPWIDPKRMRPMKIIKFKTRDGIVLDTYLTLPEGASKENPAPLVVLPHGGPYLRDDWGFDPEVQFLASRGYAVLQPNFRGSTGYSWKFPREDDYDFLKMSNDVTDATRTALKTGLVDPSRVAIMGGSFGGYLAVSGVAHEPDLYRCAVTICGVFDWEKMLKDAKYNQFDSPRYVYLKRHLGDPRKNRYLYEAISPINFVGNIKVPVFVYHGKDDWNVDVTQSKNLISLLEKHRVPHEKLLLANEGHGIGHLKEKVKVMEQIEEFLRKNLTPSVVPDGAKTIGEAKSN